MFEQFELLQKPLELNKKYGYISEEWIKELDDTEAEIRNLFSVDMTKASVEEKDSAYGKYKELMGKYSEMYQKTIFHIGFSKDEYLLLKKMVYDTTPYDRENIIIGVKVREEFFSVFDSKKNSGDTSLFKGTTTEVFDFTMQDAANLFYLTSFHKSKGLKAESEAFASVTIIHSAISTLFNYYENKFNMLSTEGGNWVQGLDEEPKQVNS